MIVFHSGYDADKTGSAGNTFNERTATYEIAEMFAGRYLSEHHATLCRELSQARRNLGATKVVHLGDIAARLSSAEIYDLITSIPEHVDRENLETLLGDREEALRRQFATHREPPGGYPLRDVLLFGVAECARSARGADRLRSDDIEGFGRLMNISHDGDRVSGLGRPASAAGSSLDRTLELWEQPGGYACSTREIDSMVDIALSAGAIGAQVTGAGLGGSMMALVTAECEEPVTHAMVLKYFQPRGIKPNHVRAVPATGARLL
jgi:galactokinase